MTETLLAFLESIEADADTIEQGTRYYLAEHTNDLPHGDMHAAILASAVDAGRAEDYLRLLEHQSDVLEQGALAVLSAAWEEPGQAELVRNALLDAKAKLPVIEAGILAIVVMYGLYLHTTGGKKREKRVVERSANGRFKETTEIEYYSATSPLTAITGLFRRPPLPQDHDEQ
ncbi:hypothetical protein AB0J80_27885 [Actinoplanes sp. NPDC049548]|uniref:hypothetical protein n=1 Tax=Actinoplanes sp. NPDC049548 TaxID=3155152 RepID=UPI00342FED23